jgi:hypothetical protein
VHQANKESSGGTLQLNQNVQHDPNFILAPVGSFLHAKNNANHLRAIVSKRQ